MKYQKLENQEANWKWIYLIRKHREGEKLPVMKKKSLEESKFKKLIECQNYPGKKSRYGLKNHLSLDLPIKLDQANSCKTLNAFFND